MKTTVSLFDFQDAFSDMNRESNFSYEGKKALFEYLENYEEETGEEIELDVIALCCEFTEYKDFEHYQDAYSNDIETLEELQDYTSIIMIDDTSFIIQDY